MLSEAEAINIGANPLYANDKEMLRYLLGVFGNKCLINKNSSSSIG